MSATDFKKAVEGENYLKALNMVEDPARYGAPTRATRGSQQKATETAKSILTAENVALVDKKHAEQERGVWDSGLDSLKSRIDTVLQRPVQTESYEEFLRKGRMGTGGRKKTRKGKSKKSRKTRGRRV